MKTKIQVKTMWGSVLFEHESENNTVKKTVIKAVESGADLRGAYLKGADLTGAYLRSADLRGAYLRGADLRSADLRGAYLTSADLRSADLRGAYLTSAYLKGADLRSADLTGANNHKITIEKVAIFTGLYEHIVMAIVDKEGVKWVKLGCFTRKLSEWEKDFWNNDDEFPNDGSEKSESRMFAFKTAKMWFTIKK